MICGIFESHASLFITVEAILLTNSNWNRERKHILYSLLSRRQKKRDEGNLRDLSLYKRLVSSILGNWCVEWEGHKVQSLISFYFAGGTVSSLEDFLFEHFIEENVGFCYSAHDERERQAIEK